MYLSWIILFITYLIVPLPFTASIWAGRGVAATLVAIVITKWSTT